MPAPEGHTRTKHTTHNSSHRNDSYFVVVIFVLLVPSQIICKTNKWNRFEQQQQQQQRNNTVFFFISQNAQPQTRWEGINVSAKPTSFLRNNKIAKVTKGQK